MFIFISTPQNGDSRGIVSLLGQITGRYKYIPRAEEFSPSGSMWDLDQIEQPRFHAVLWVDGSPRGSGRNNHRMGSISCGAEPQPLYTCPPCSGAQSLSPGSLASVTHSRPEGWDIHFAVPLHTLLSSCPAFTTSTAPWLRPGRRLVSAAVGEPACSLLPVCPPLRRGGFGSRPCRRGPDPPLA